MSVAFCAPESISLGVQVPVHRLEGVGVKRKVGYVHAVCGQTECIRALSGSKTHTHAGCRYAIFDRAGLL